MKFLYQKSEICFAVAWIIAYCVLASMGDRLSASMGMQKIITLPFLIAVSVFLFLFVHKNHLLDKYGLRKSEIPASKMLFYIPLLALLTVNLWFGGSIHTSKFETVLYILSMMCVGFLEEMIFRGFLFCAMAAGFMLIIIICVITFSSDWSCIASLLSLAFGTNRGDFKKQMLWLIFYVAMYSIVYFFALDQIYGFIQMGVILAIPVLMMYNGQRGSNQKINHIIKWLFYIYYPLHLWAIGLIQLFIRNYD